MDLNLPIFDQVSDCKNLLIAGMGGGFDVFCGLPIYFELQRRGINVHLANYSFSNIETLKKGIRLTDTLVGVTTEIDGHFVYFPELYLTQWFKAKYNADVPIWCFHKTGVRPLLENYQELVDFLKLDGIILIDGGVDSLMRGDEYEVGTIIEDSISLIVVGDLKDVPVRLIACIGFGAERDMAYEQVLGNIATLAKTDAFLGSCSLMKQMEVYQDYESAVLTVQGQPHQDASVINSSIISAVRGEFANHHLTDKTAGSRLWISPLMPIYWFFDLPPVARRTLLYSALRYTDTFQDAWRAMLQFLQKTPKRRPSRIPLP
ncbi:MAG: DUF1152 domain-containing protein [Chloroflexota bacterium]